VPITRRSFLASSAAVAVAAAGALSRSTPVGARGQQAPTHAPLFSPIRRDVGYFTARGGTIAYLINAGGIAVVDCQYPDSARLCIEGLNARSGNRRIDVVFNTHHHADHTGGNVVFRGLTKKIVASDNVTPLQTLAASTATSPVEQVFADTMFTNRWSTGIGGERVTATFYGPAHTGGDAIVHFENADVVHVGDLVWNRMQAFVDRGGGASVAHWLDGLERIAAAYSADTTYVFGHASRGQVTGTRKEVLVMRDYLTAVMELVNAGRNAGKSRDQVVASTDVLKGFEDFGPLTRRVLEGTYDELAAG
jgi:cyclase